MSTVSPRRAATVVGVVGTGLVQYAIADRGRQSAAGTEGMAGIGVALGYGALTIAVSVVIIVTGARLLGLRLWFLAGLSIAAGDALLLTVTWDLSGRAGLQGLWRSLAFVVALAVAVSAWIGLARFDGGRDQTASRRR